ncbi:putative C6 transcription factor [Aspergillus campestris IBT 28561]|uniref:C6 transcription factor n=1 Tax=Aspergillus campestris (strain IBT 28561) TaxID=1392248 RepID=A0A2I1D473_ASPC2|nr:putative C6 transcription factor [Aspergillus campestris IBT 28561]PKY04677.1 putative C6 transcription factor [Aspergillus campestris IBT 28561]
MEPTQPGDEPAGAIAESPTDDSPSAVGKRRWRRNRIACDSCHSRRVRCDRAFPCSRCLRSDVHCQFTRERRKRGRIARPKLAETDARLEKAPPPEPSAAPMRKDRVPAVVGAEAVATPAANVNSPELSFHHRSPVTNDVTMSVQSVDERRSQASTSLPSTRPRVRGNVTEEWLSGAHVSPGAYEDLRASGLLDDVPQRVLEMWNGVDLAAGGAPTSNRSKTSQSAGGQSTSLKYPVLQPLMPYVEANLPRRLVFDLLELYFTSAFSTYMHPVCHHIHCYVLRKASFLTRDNYRASSPALLASMLWVAALDDRAFALPISPPQRKKICQFLCALTIHLLRPLIHVSFKDQAGNSTSTPGAAAGVAPEGPPPTVHHSFEGRGDDWGLVGPAGSLDDVITYVHVASIISSSEQKAASMRWWHAAFTLARELKLNQEIDVMPSVDNHPEDSSPSVDYSLSGWDGVDTGPFFDHANPARSCLNCVCDRTTASGATITEESREERRRAWWLLYIMDRHLALCYNRPLALLDAESEDLLLPLDEGSWQAGNIHSNSPKPDGPQCALSGVKNRRRVFPNFICHDHSIFGFFLPLMTITGELIDLNQARNHPMLGVRLHGKDAWDVHLNEVLGQLEIYKASLTTFAATTVDTSTLLPATYPTSKPDAPAVDPALAQAYSWHTQTVISYASYLVHVLHILLVGKWDPVSLIEDKDFWTSSPAFASTISHALDAADSVNQILRYDPDISFMPYFFGIQLLQGSFLLLLIVERLQKEAGEGILNACEVMIRATESCVVTLNTEYQRNFRQVMRSAVAQARGRPVNHSEIRHRRKAVLALYRWTRKGTGLAL